MAILVSGDYESLTDVASADMTEGEFKQLGSTSVYGFSFAKVSSGMDYTFVYECEKATATAKSTDVITRGVTLYFDPVNKYVTITSTDNVKCGFALEPKANGQTTVLMYFDGKIGV